MRKEGSMKTIALILFLATYVAMIALPAKRAYAAAITAAIFIILRIVPLGNIPGAIDWNVLMMITGTMVTVYIFIESKMPNLIADILLDKSKNVMWVTIFLSLFAGVVSAFIDNVATVLMIAPVAMAIAKKLKISPVSMIISIAISSNLQGAATLVGDTTSIMLGGYAKMDFLDFFVMQGKPCMFFSVELGALATIPVMMYIFRKDTKPVEAKEKTKVRDFIPGILLLLNIVLLITASFWKEKPEITNGLICIMIAVVADMHSLLRNKDIMTAKSALLEIDFFTLLLLTSLFIVIDGLTEMGVIRDISAMIVKVGGNNMFVLYSVIVWGSVLISAFIDNIPYVATMLPVVQGIAGMLGVEPYLLYFGLLTGATLGGNLTPIGASANITGIGILRKSGHEVSMKDFMRISVPFTLVAVTVGYLFCWFIWK